MSDSPEVKPNPSIDIAAKKRKRRVVTLITLTFIFASLIVFSWWFLYARFEVSTSDAYVHGNQVKLTPQIAGIVTEVNVDETELVQEGQVLIKLDETDQKIAFGMAKHELAEMIRQVNQMFENVYSLAALFEMSQAQLFSTEVDYLDRKNVVVEGAVSDEEFIHAESNYYAAKAAVQKARFDLMQAISLVQNTTIATHPFVEKAKDQVRQTWVNLQRCTLRSPVTGIIAQRAVQVGESGLPTTPLLAIIPLDQMWVNANFKETDISKIRIGQMVSMRADTYGHEIVYRGEVVGIALGSGSVFSPLPPQNATGNWIKIVQRVPVRISLSNEQLKRFPLRLGLSMSVKVDVRNTEGNRVPLKSLDRSLYSTDVFADQAEGAEEIIKELLEQNITYDMSISHDVLSLVGR